jgi:hypothetical protein
MYKSTTNLMENTMFKFEDQYKKFDEVLDRTQSMYEFWINVVLSTTKEFFNTSKTK